MLSNSKNPFAAAPSNGSARNPFQSVGTNGSASSNGSETSSPFGAASPTPIPEQRANTVGADSPFALVENPERNGASHFEPELVEPTEGFAASEEAVAPVATPPPVAMPQSAEVNANQSDPFAAPVPSASVERSDFVLPSESGQLPPSQNIVHAESVSEQVITEKSASVAASDVTGETSQLVLRAIFGVTRELDRDEILQRTRTLPGIRNLHIVGQSEGAAMSSLRGSIQRMGFGDHASLALTTSGGVVDFIEEQGTTLAVLHEGVYAAGVRETLIIVARELSRLS